MIFGGNPDYWKKWREDNLPDPETTEAPVVVEFDTVTAWRFGYLCGLGFDPDTALRLAEALHVDLRKADELVEKGCSLEVAVRILL